MANRIEILPVEPPTGADHERCAACGRRLQAGECARCGSTVSRWIQAREPGFIASQAVLAGLAVCAGASLTGFWMVFDSSGMLRSYDAAAYDRAWRILVVQSAAVAFWVGALRLLGARRPRVVLRAGVPLIGFSLLAAVVVWNRLEALL